MISKKIIQTSLIYTLAGALPMASAVILLPFYGKLSAPVFGAMSIYFSASILIQILVTYSFDTSLYINYHEFKHEANKLATFISSSFIFILIISTFVSIFFALGGEFIFSKVYVNSEISFYPFGLLTVVTGISQSLLKVYNSLLQTQQKPIPFLLLNIFSFSFTAVLTIVGLHAYPNTLWGPIGGKMIALLCSAAWVISCIVRKFGIRFEWNLLKTTFSFNRSAYLYQIQQWLINYLDRPLLLLFISLATVGVYDLALKLMLCIEFVLVGLNSSIHPKALTITAAQLSKGSTVEINRYYHGLTAISMLLVTICVFLFPLVIDLFFNQSGYHQAISLLPFAGIIYLLKPLRLFVAFPYSAIKYSKPLPIYYLIVLAVKIMAMYLLIKPFGIQGAIVSTIISYIVEISILYIGIYDQFTFKINVFKLVVSPLGLIGLILILEPLFANKYLYQIHGLYVLITVCILTWIYRKEIQSIIS